MAKQTFTTGQVLTAAQMTSLQQTAMGGGSATAKTANYVLVAADAGTTVAMNAAGATTITVNTGLFAAGDTVFIQNLGAGACTVTAGTATVATAGSLILPQNDAGILYFTATGASIFYDFIQAGAVSPLTTKGDLFTFSTVDARLGVGANDTVLTADSAEATGLKWAAPAGGGTGGYTLLNTSGTALSGSATVTVSSITSNDLLIFIVGAASSSSSVGLNLKFNSSSTNHFATGFRIIGNSSYAASNFDQVNASNAGVLNLAFSSNTANRPMFASCLVQACTSTAVKPLWYSGGCDGGAGTGQQSNSAGGYFDAAAAITSVSAVCQNGTFNAGTLFVYGRS